MRCRSVLVCIAVLLLAGCGRPPRPPGPPVQKMQEISADTISPAEEADDQSKLHADDWAMWRGSQSDGVASGPEIPASWTDRENVAWKIRLPGRGHSSPTVVGERICLETADEQAKSQSILCLDRRDGKVVWQKDLFRGNLETAMHAENTQATSTIASDGERLYALFLNDRKIWATCLDLDGTVIWQTEVGNFASKFGYSASPILYRSLLLLAADHEQGGYIAALHRGSGKIIWRKSRPARSSYASPRVVNLGGRDQMVLCGCGIVASYDPRTGDQIWSTTGTAEAAVGSPVVDEDLVFASGGYPEQETIGLKPDGTVAWRNNVKSYVPSLLAYAGCVYLVSDDGIARCYEAATGREKWKHRVGGNFRVSPIVSGNRIYATDMSGTTTVFAANPEKFELIAKNHLGTEAFASPAVSRGELFLRIADNSSGSRQEWLYCISQVGK